MELTASDKSARPPVTELRKNPRERGEHRKLLCKKKNIEIFTKPVLKVFWDPNSIFILHL